MTLKLSRDDARRLLVIVEFYTSHVNIYAYQEAAFLIHLLDRLKKGAQA